MLILPLGTGAVPLVTQPPASAVLGQANLTSGAANRGGPVAANTLKEPRSVALDSSTGRLYVADTGNNRVLGYASATAFANGENAVVILGQPVAEAAVPSTGAAGLNAPRGVAVDRAGNVYVADTGNHRVLVYPAPVTGFGPAAGIVFGQNGSFVANTPNNPAEAASRRLNQPSGVHITENGYLLIADTGNNRVKVHQTPLRTEGTSTGAGPVRCLGGGAGFCGTAGGTTASLLLSPEGVASYPDGRIIVADTGNHRVLVFGGPENGPATAADLVRGQPGFTDGFANAGVGTPVANGFASPSQIALDREFGLWVADRGNSRVVRYAADAAGSLLGEATSVLGQADFVSSATILPPAATSLDLPRGVAVDGAGNVYVADTGASRALRYNQPLPLPQPLITSAGPNAVVLPAGEVVLTIGGRGFHAGNANATATAIRVNGTTAGIVTTWASPWLLVAQVPAGAIAGGPADTFTIEAVTVLAGGGSLASAPVVRNLETPVTGDRRADRLLGQPNMDTVGIFAPLGGPGNSASAGRIAVPYGVAVDPVTGRVWVTDVFFHRVLGFPSMAALQWGQPADIVLGQPDLLSYRANRGQATPNARTLNQPTGIVVDGNQNVYVADSGNHRVLVYPAPHSTGMPAAGVIGQPNFNGNTPNALGMGIRTLNLPRGLALAPDGSLLVSDSGNNRVLVFDDPANAGTGFPGARPGQIYGQPNATSLGTGNGASQLNRPYGVATFGNRVWISDSNNHRVLGYTGTSTTADTVIGQAAFGTNLANQGGPVSATGLNGPDGIATDRAGWLYVADGANSRVLAWPPGTSGAGAAAQAVFGQDDFTTSTWGVGPGRLAEPGAVGLDPAGNLWVTDGGNLRVVRYDRPLQPPITSQLPQVFMRNAAGW